MRYFTSDLHFYHENIIGFCNRPFMSISDMNTVLLDNINSIVKKDDLLYILGDFSFAPKSRNVQIVKSIACPVVLIRGNHDQTARIKNLPFEEMYDELDLQLGSHLVTLSHFPYSFASLGIEDTNHDRVDRFADARPKNNGLWLLHGHTHDKLRIRRKEKQIHVGCDAWNYHPVSEIDIENLIEDKI